MKREYLNEINRIKKLMLINEEENNFVKKLVSLKPLILVLKKNYLNFLAKRPYPILNVIDSRDQYSVNSLLKERSRENELAIIYLIIYNSSYWGTLIFRYNDGKYFSIKNNGETFELYDSVNNEVLNLDFNNLFNYLNENISNVQKIHEQTGTFEEMYFEVIKTDYYIYTNEIKKISVASVPIYGLKVSDIEIRTTTLTSVDNLYAYLYNFRLMSNTDVEEFKKIIIESGENVESNNGINMSYLDFIISLFAFLEKKNNEFYKRIYKKSFLGNQSMLAKALASNTGKEVRDMFRKHGFSTDLVNKVFDEKLTYKLLLKLKTDSKQIIKALCNLFGVIVSNDLNEKKPDEFFIDEIKKLYGSNVTIKDNNIMFENCILDRRSSTKYNALVLKPTNKEVIFEKQRNRLAKCKDCTANIILLRVLPRELYLDFYKDEFIMEISDI